MLAELLEKLFDDEAYSPQIRAIGAMAFIAIMLVLFLNFGKTPTHADDIAAAKSISYKGLIKRKAPNIRKRIQVWIRTSGGGLDEADNLESFYQEPAYARLVLKMTDNFFPYDAARPFSLPLQANVGDSVIKKSGELTAKVIYGDSAHIFRYKCAWHPDVL
jgi:hypothetical protein